MPKSLVFFTGVPKSYHPLFPTSSDKPNTYTRQGKLIQHGYTDRIPKMQTPGCKNANQSVYDRENCNQASKNEDESEEQPDPGVVRRKPSIVIEAY